MGFLGRIGNSFIGALIGLVVLPVSVLLLGWNEYRTVQRSHGIAEAKSVVVSIPDANEVAADLNDKLVHLTGLATTEEILRDPQFAVEEVGIHLARRVEMYQWVEDKRTTGTGNNRKTEYDYELKWESGRVDSSRFEEPSAHLNPDLGIPETSVTADDVHIGRYQLSDPLKHEMDDYIPVFIVEDQVLEDLPEDQWDQLVVRNNELFWSATAPNPDQPELGDLRIRFEVVRPAEVSLVAKLQGDKFSEYRTSNNEPFERLYLGAFSAEQVMEKLTQENTLMAWLLRIMGTGMSVVGFWMILGPIRSITSFIPVLAQLTGGLVFVVSLLMGTIISLTVIAVAWIAVRPLLGIGLLVIVFGAVFLVVRIFMGRKRMSQDEEDMVMANPV
ncbi:MAG: TMEM43 family protein [Pirellulaceae bacterium]